MSAEGVGPISKLTLVVSEKKASLKVLQHLKDLSQPHLEIGLCLTCAS